MPRVGFPSFLASFIAKQLARMSLYSALLSKLSTANSHCVICEVPRDCMMEFHSQGPLYKTGTMIRKRNEEAATSAVFLTPGQTGDCAVL